MATLVALAARVSTARGTPYEQPADSAAVVAQTRLAANDFVRTWRYYWEVSERYRHVLSNGEDPNVPLTWNPPFGVPAVILSADDSLDLNDAWAGHIKDPIRVIQDRLTLLHCHTEGPVYRDFDHLDSHLIESRANPPQTGKPRAVCPSWEVDSTGIAWDEGRTLDGPVLPRLRPLVTATRAALLTKIEAAARQLPGDGWLSGQWVRFALDQGDMLAAARAVSACKADGWWCTALAGYVSVARGEMPRADSTFAAMLAAMPQNTRCDWTNLGTLVESSAQRAYNATPCGPGRDSVNTRLWWLADPLYTEPGNERRAQHFARKVLIALRAGTDFQEHWDMSPKGGGDAVAEMLIRYGWPTFTFWGGRAEDAGHFGYLGFIAGDTMTLHGRFATAEYSDQHFHSVPSWNAITTPSRAPATAWELTAAAYIAPSPKDSAWWPDEFYDRPSGSLVQLGSQVGLFRRRNDVLLALGVDMPARSGPTALGDSLAGALVLSTSPDSITRRATGAHTGGIRTFSFAVPVQPAVASLELFGAGASPVAARTRFGIEPPPALTAMRPGDIAIAAPVLVRPPAALTDLPSTNPDTALARMFGARIDDWSNVGIYWETYGIGASDTVQIELRLEGKQQMSVLQRVGASLGVAATGRSTVAFKWQEPASGHNVTTIEGPVPIQGRNITLDLSRLPPADYTVVVSVTRGARPPVTASRVFSIPPVAKPR